MGMFDNIRCEYPLPESGYRVLPGHLFQTKSFECTGESYTITADGRMVLYRKRYGSLRAVPEREEEISCHGDVSFYDVIPVSNEASQVLIQYKATFVEGRLSHVEVEDVQDLTQYRNIVREPQKQEDGKELH